MKPPTACVFPTALLAFDPFTDDVEVCAPAVAAAVGANVALGLEMQELATATAETEEDA